MTDAGFPTDDYTPHGYLANPFAVAHSWSDGAGGCLRSSRDHVGFGWQLPWALRAQASVELIVALESGGRRLLTRADFAETGLVSPHHTSSLFTYRWEAFGRRWEAAYALVEQDALGLQVTWEPASDASPDLADVTLSVVLVGTRRTPPSPRETALTPQPPLPHHGNDEASRLRRLSVAGEGEPASGTVDLGEPFGRYALQVENDAVLQARTTVGLPAADPSASRPDSGGDEHDSAAVRLNVGAAPSGGVHAVAGGLPLSRVRERGAGGEGFVRGPGAEGATPGGEGRLPGAEGLAALIGASIQRAREADHWFWSAAARLEGDWPDSWRRGWVYDAETTRMCVFPPGGIFQDVWPSWMIQWPRAVVAEGTLDMARFAYLSPDLAKRAVLSLFRDATAPNVPCVFRDGEPNMVAADGSVCGTSPAWCIPFYNLERLFAFTLDRDWLSEIYPHLARFVEWWLAERTDPEGWAVYRCTWEAGEDDTPRLDPERRGDNVVSAFVRPVELQATMALSAGVLARFAAVLGLAEDVARWRTVEAAYLDRTRQLWDDAAGRFRDREARAGHFLAPAGPGEPTYWGIDPCRYSALAFTPLLAGLTDASYRAGLRRELGHYAGPPWTLWASWSYVVLEAAPLTEDPTLDTCDGGVGFAGRVAAEVVDRVYRELDLRDPAGPSHPTPGVAREYWPLDLDGWASCEGYGWGANTASLLVRQVFGFSEGPYLPDMPRLTFELRPALPDAFLVPGREYWLANLPYRGARLDVGYRVMPEGVMLLISTGISTHGQVRSAGGVVLYRSDDPSERHEVAGHNGASYTVELRPAAVVTVVG